MTQHNKKSLQSKNTIDKIIDFVKFFAVTFMITSHVIAFFYEGNGILKLLQYFADTFCFSIFLFCSGASTYMSVLNISNHKWEGKKKSYIYSIIRLLMVYYTVAVFSALEDMSGLSIIQVFAYLLKILVFVIVPDYTEFLIAFIIFKILVFIFRSQFKKTANNIFLTFILGFIFYILGFVFHSFNIAQPLNFLTSLFVGYKDWFRFPVFQYMLIFLNGIFFASTFSANPKKINITFRNVIFSLFGLTLLAFLSQYMFGINDFFTMQRWPPCALFILIGLIFVYILTFLLRSINTSKYPFIKTIARNTLGVYAFHIIILEIIDLLFKFKTTNEFVILICSLAIIIISVVFNSLFKHLIKK